MLPFRRTSFCAPVEAKDDTIEGVTLDHAGTLYLVAEGGSKSLPSHMCVLNAVPEPSWWPWQC